MQVMRVKVFVAADTTLKQVLLIALTGLMLMYILQSTYLVILLITKDMSGININIL